jgi:hypothetical protein
MKLTIHEVIKSDDDSERDAISQRLLELMKDDSTKTLAFLWDENAEQWLCAAMWQGDAGCNFLVDGDTAATLMAMFISLYRVVTEDE